MSIQSSTNVQKQSSIVPKLENKKTMQGRRLINNFKENEKMERLISTLSAVKVTF